jgi:hypothetical protein
VNELFLKEGNMLDFEGINYLAVAVVWLVSVVVGAYWYSPAGFGKLWAKLSGVNHLKMPEAEATKTIGFVAVSAVVQVYVLAVVLNSLNINAVGNGVLAGIVLWLGFTAATTVGNTLYQRLGWKFWWLNASYFLLVMAVNSAILVAWR